jgi:hypothetical protein
MSDHDDNGNGRGNPLEALPGIARIAASAAWHTAAWGVNAYVDTWGKMLKAASSPDAAATFASEVRDSARSAARDLIDVTELEDRVRSISPTTETRAIAAPQPRNPLQDAGDELMRKGRDVRYEEDAHPAYERILSELAPDEGRILRLLLLSGPQPAVDVRTGGPLGLFNSRLLAPGLSMIGPRAGVRYLDRVPSYLNNLFRLGLIWFSRETLRDVHRYQVVEAQPDVLEAMKSVRQAKLVRRSIHLTPFGEDFCRVCLKLDTEVLEALPEHSSPLETDKVAAPPAE